MVLDVTQLDVLLAVHGNPVILPWQLARYNNVNHTALLKMLKNLLVGWIRMFEITEFRQHLRWMVNVIYTITVTGEIIMFIGC